MRIDPGKMDRLITIQQETADSPPQDATGEPSASWTTYAQHWAQKFDVGGKERWLPSGRQAEVNTVFRIYYDSGVTHAMRISLDSVTYDIQYINEIGRREGLEIRATARRD
jgi:SPP1 family predicted phage head-tail adaptor